MCCIQCGKDIPIDGMYIEFFGNKVFCGISCELITKEQLSNVINDIKDQENYRRFFHETH